MIDKTRKTLAEMRAEAISGDGKDPWACPSCGCRNWKVTNVWQSTNGNRKRLRKCRSCGSPMATCEMPVADGFRLDIVPDDKA